MSVFGANIKWSLNVHLLQGGLILNSCETL